MLKKGIQMSRSSKGAEAKPVEEQKQAPAGETVTA
jgi:hypothetical protein